MKLCAEARKIDNRKGIKAETKYRVTAYIMDCQLLVLYPHRMVDKKEEYFSVC
jgi:hypothetical protein